MEKVKLGSTINWGSAALVVYGEDSSGISSSLWKIPVPKNVSDNLDKYKNFSIEVQEEEQAVVNRLDKNGVHLLVENEGSIPRIYPDSGGAPTIGIGHLLTKSEKASGKIWIKGNQHKSGRFIYIKQGDISDDDVQAILQQDLESVYGTIIVAVKVPLTQNQFNALTSFVFNIGNTAFINSTLLRLLNQGKYEEVPAQMRRWKYDNGKVVKGLVARRERTITMWNGEY